MLHGMVIWARGLLQTQSKRLQNENPSFFLSVPAYRSNYWRATILLFYLDYETMKTESFDYETRIECEQGSTLSVDKFDNGLWLIISVHGAHARAILTREQGLELIAAIYIALSAEEGEE